MSIVVVTFAKPGQSTQVARNQITGLKAKISKRVLPNSLIKIVWEPANFSIFFSTLDFPIELEQTGAEDSLLHLFGGSGLISQNWNLKYLPISQGDISTAFGYFWRYTAPTSLDRQKISVQNQLILAQTEHQKVVSLLKNNLQIDLKQIDSVNLYYALRVIFDSTNSW